jgi:hypothetical protein
MLAPFRQTHHLDRYVEDFLPWVAEGDPDELLDTKAVARLFHVSKQWLEIGRCKGYGPPFIKLGPLMVRYRRGTLVKWLKSRAKAAMKRRAR